MMSSLMDNVAAERSWTPPMASVIVVTRDRADSLARALSALRDLGYPNYEIIVVDNDSRDHTKEVVKLYGVQYVFSPSECGIGCCRQRGVEAAKGEIIAFCDDDCVPAGQWLYHLARRLTRELDLGVVGGNVINVGFPDEESKRYKGRSRLQRNGKLAFVEDLKKAEFFGNMNLAFRRDVIEAVGGYDPFFNTMAEIDLQVRIRKLGYRVDFETEAVLEHYYTGIHYKYRHFFYGPDLVRLYFCMKHFRPGTVGEWFSFLGYESQLLAQEQIRALKRFLASLRKWRLDRLTSSALQIFNTVSARLAIPWLVWRTWGSQIKSPHVHEA